MFKKSGLTILSAVFVLLLALVLIFVVFDRNKNEKNFESQFVEIDTSKVSSITIYPKGAKEGEEYKMVKKSDNWKIEQNGNVYTPDKRVAKSMLDQLAKIKSERIAATKKERWQHYEVTDTVAVRIVVQEGNKTTDDLLIGKFSYQKSQNPYQQQQGKMTTYVRERNSNTVHAVEGFLNMIFNRRVNDLRNKMLTGFDKNNITKIKFDYPADSSFTLLKNENGKWMINNSPADSAKAVNYINQISNFRAVNFVDNFNINNSQKSHELTIEGNNMSAINITAYPADTINKYVVTSSMNVDGKFSGSQGKLFNRAFKSARNFMPIKQEE